MKCCCKKFKEWHNSARVRSDIVYWIVCINSEFEKEPNKWKWKIIKYCLFCGKEFG